MQSPFLSTIGKIMLVNFTAGNIMKAVNLP